MTASTAGKLLIGTPAIRDGIFDQAVLLMLHHDAAGALGLIISTPTELSIGELLPRWADLCVAPTVVFEGGPVERNGFIGLGRSRTTEASEIAQPIVGDSPTVGGLVSIDLDGDPMLAAASVDRLRIFRGHAGWAPGQLDGELDRGAWFVVDAGDDLWSDEPSGLYEQVLRRQPGSMRWFANAPIDPSVN